MSHKLIHDGEKAALVYQSTAALLPYSWHEKHDGREIYSAGFQTEEKARAYGRAKGWI